MRKRLPPLDSLRVLAACVRHGNFSRAAAELGITPTAVSQRIRALEAEMGVQLFKRHGPKLTATDRARALGQRLEQALLLVRSAVDDCRRVKQPLRVTCAPTFAARWLMPRLSAYHAMPGADAIVLDNTQAVLPEAGFRRSHSQWQRPMARRSGSETDGGAAHGDVERQPDHEALDCKVSARDAVDTRPRVGRVVQAGGDLEGEARVCTDTISQLRA